MNRELNQELKDDRIIVLKQIEGKQPLTNTGLVDPRMFLSGNNKLHAILEQETGLWYLRYESGILPEPLRQKFTKYSVLKDFTERYFNKRNIEIDKVID